MEKQYIQFLKNTLDEKIEEGKQLEIEIDQKRKIIYQFLNSMNEI